MNNNLTEIVCIIDRSGSMASITNDAIGGFNTFLAEQKKLPGEARLTLVLFDHEYLVPVDNQPLDKVEELTASTYVPRGSTALMDAIGRAITTVGERLAKTEEAQRPGQVVVVILTDGFENASQEYTRTRVAEMIQHQQEKYNWRFVYLGVNVDAFKEASSLNIAPTTTFVDAYGNTRTISNAGTVAYSAAGINSGYSFLSDATAAYRTASNITINNHVVRCLDMLEQLANAGVESVT